MSAEGRTGVWWNVRYPKVLHYQFRPFARKIPPLPWIFLWLFCAPCALFFPGNREGREISAPGTEFQALLFPCCPFMPTSNSNCRTAVHHPALKGALIFSRWVWGN